MQVVHTTDSVCSSDLLRLGFLVKEFAGVRSVSGLLVEKWLLSASSLAPSWLSTSCWRCQAYFGFFSLRCRVLVRSEGSESWLVFSVFPDPFPVDALWVFTQDKSG